MSEIMAASRSFITAFILIYLECAGCCDHHGPDWCPRGLRHGYSELLKKTLGRLVGGEGVAHLRSEGDIIVGVHWCS